MIRTTVGKLLVNQALPPDLRDWEIRLDKKTVKGLFKELAERYPDQYPQVLRRLGNLGRLIAYWEGGFGFGLRDLKAAQAAKRWRAQLRRQVDRILAGPGSPEQKQRRLIELLAEAAPKLEDEIYRESQAEGNPLVEQVASGARGNRTHLRSLRGADLLYVDHREQPVPLAVLKSVAEGLSPAEFWASTYGARKGIVDVKQATADAGYFGKQLNQAAHRLLVLDEDGPEPEVVRGLPVDVDDPDNEGALLAAPAGPFPRNTPLTAKVLAKLRSLGIKRILVRSPLVGGPPGGGVYARDVGYREYGRLPRKGELVGMTAAQALSEPLTQGQLSSKHGGGVLGGTKAVSGFAYINALAQAQRHIQGGAAHAEVDGRVESIKEAPQGGLYIRVAGKDHYVEPGLKPLVKVGQEVSAGDVLSTGIPNPGLIVKYKGIGEGRRHLVQALVRAYRESGLPIHRRNAELVVRGLVDHVRFHEPLGKFLPGDVVSYQAVEWYWRPRPGAQAVDPNRAVGRYLERPVLHYTVGTRLTPAMVKELQEHGVKEVLVHEEAPPFEPEMVPARFHLQYDPDWLTRQYGTHIKKTLLSAAQYGGESDLAGTSFVPAIAQGGAFGRLGPAGVKSRFGAK